MKRPLRIVIVGAAGRLGQALEARLSREAEVIGLARPRIDLSSERSIIEALDPLEFDRLILTAAMTAVDPCETEREKAFQLNASAPKLIAGICAAKKSHMTYVSTDFVFDGEKEQPYSEADTARPLGVYGASKLKGEEHVLAASDTHLVIRVSWLYGPGKPAFPEWIVDKACGESGLSLPTDKIGSPTSSTDVAELLVPLLFRADGVPESGIFHLCNAGSCTWQEWGQCCLDLARDAGIALATKTISGNSLADIPAFLARRPPNSALSPAKYTSVTGVSPRAWQEALRDHIGTSDFLRKRQTAACG